MLLVLQDFVGKDSRVAGVEGNHHGTVLVVDGSNRTELVIWGEICDTQSANIVEKLLVFIGNSIWAFHNLYAWKCLNEHIVFQFLILSGKEI